MRLQLAAAVLFVSTTSPGCLQPLPAPSEPPDLQTTSPDAGGGERDVGPEGSDRPLDGPGRDAGARSPEATEDGATTPRGEPDDIQGLDDAADTADLAEESGVTEDGGSAAGGACMNSNDLSICDACELNCHDACPDPLAFAVIVAEMCSLAAIGANNEQQHARDCVVLATGLSPSCGACHADTMLCVVHLCIPACLAPSSAACDECKALHCLPEFYACTGYEEACDDGLDNNGLGGADCDDQSCAYEAACLAP